MTEGSDFPVLSAGDLVKAFPDMKAGDLLKISHDDLGDVAVGEFVVLHRSGSDERELSILPVREADAASTGSSDVGARVSSVEGAAVTLEVTSSPEGR